jgi:hypothetical protein
MNSYSDDGQFPRELVIDSVADTVDQGFKKIDRDVSFEDLRPIEDSDYESFREWYNDMREHSGNKGIDSTLWEDEVNHYEGEEGEMFWDYSICPDRMELFRESPMDDPVIYSMPEDENIVNEGVIIQRGFEEIDIQDTSLGFSSEEMNEESYRFQIPEVIFYNLTDERVSLDGGKIEDIGVIDDHIGNSIEERARTINSSKLDEASVRNRSARHFH